MPEIEYLTVDHLSIKQIRAIFGKIIIDPATGCWNWRGAKDDDEYGFASCDSGQHRVHRILYAWTTGPIPKGVQGRKHGQIDHLCRNHSCCNPIHLELVTQQINVLRGTSPIAKAAKQTHCIYGHLLTKTKNGKRRECKTCDNRRKKVRVSGSQREYWLQKAREATKRYYDKQRAGGNQYR